MKKLRLIIVISLILLLIPIGINFYVMFKSKEKIYDGKEIKDVYDIALVLGCSVLKDGSPSKMLKDRLDAAIYLYKTKIVKQILISGDHSKTYSEITTMHKYLLNESIKEEDILVDSIGYSTGESLLNYKQNYNNKSVVIVTQKYHLYRALFIAEKLDLDAIGTHAKLINYSGQLFREIREILARNKDFILYNFVNYQ